MSPNPFNSYVLIEGKGYDQTATYRVFNQLGQQVAVKAGNLSATTKMDLDNLTEGVYLLQVEAFGVSYTQKIVKQ